MCGIAGIILRSGADCQELHDKLLMMARSMAHRGPDDEGIYVSPDGSVGLVNRRLAIRDLSSAGHMPMSNADDGVWITYNGEIYNLNELRNELVKLGYLFRSNSDTEIILHSYEAWGSDFVRRLRGMFVFAIYDRRGAFQENPYLLIARDHMGIKPVYYYKTSNAFIFASELKVLFASGLVSREMNPTGLVGYLLTGSLPNPYTIYNHIWALEPSTFVEIRQDHLQDIQQTKYWSLPDDTSNVSSLDEAVEGLRALLSESVRIRLVSDVPLGAFLSGGLDSSSIVALMRQATNGPIRTCSMIFDEQPYSEALYARAVADTLGTEHFERVITFNDVIGEFDNILLGMDQPTIDGVNTYFVSQTARQAGLTVALSGLGGDELFGGYRNTFRDTPRMLHAFQWAQRVPLGVNLATTVIARLPGRQGWARVQDALQRPASLASAYLTRRGLFSPTEVRQLVRPELWAEANFDPVAHVALNADTSDTKSMDSFSWVSRAELRTYTSNQLLRDTDVMSMIHSLEVRVPLLDRELVSFVLRLPTWMKTSGDRQPKPLFARAMKGLLPSTVLDRRDKQGFVFPFAEWLRGGLAERTSQVLEQVKNGPYVDSAAVDQVMTRFQRGEIHWSRAWALVALGCVV